MATKLEEQLINTAQKMKQLRTLSKPKKGTPGKPKGT